jgi:hypothetical protein
MNSGCPARLPTATGTIVIHDFEREGQVAATEFLRSHEEQFRPDRTPFRHRPER